MENTHASLSLSLSLSSLRSSALLFPLLIAATSPFARAQDFVVDWIDTSRPTGQISVNVMDGVWEDYSEGGGSGTVDVDGADLVLKNGLGITVCVLKGAAGATGGDSGATDDGTGTTSIGFWTCVEF